MKRITAYRGITHTILIFLGIFWVYPFIWTAFAALKTPTEFVTSGVKLFPESFQWSNFARAWNEANFSSYTENTVILTVFTVLIVITLCSLTGYALGRVDFPGKKILITLFVATMFIPKGYTIIPVYLLVKWLGLLNTMPGLILVESSGAHVVFILLFMTYFMKLPKELEESAEIDGAGFVRTFVSVMLPLSKPIIATIGIVQFINTWNSFFVPLIFTLGNPNLRTLAVGMVAFSDEVHTDYVGMAAGATIAIVPIILVFIIFQRYFIEGISGAVKQ